MNLKATGGVLNICLFPFGGYTSTFWSHERMETKFSLDGGEQSDLSPIVNNPSPGCDKERMEYTDDRS